MDQGNDHERHKDKLELKRFYFGACMWLIMGAVELFVKPIPWPIYMMGVVVLGVDIENAIKAFKSRP